MAQPLVSVITPAYNAEKYLAEAIESVLSQTYPHWELIIVDDGSTDGTAEIAKRYAAKDRRIQYCWQENKRMASARNAGIRRAGGKYVAFLDADNIFLPQKLEKQIAYLESRSDCGVCYGKILFFYGENTAELYENIQPTHTGNVFRQVLYRNFINVLAAVIRKDLLDERGAFPEGWKACDEHYMWVNLAYHGAGFCYLDEVVGWLRLHPAEDSRRKDIILMTAECYLRLLDTVEEWFTPEEKVMYRGYISSLRARWKKLLFVGKMLAHPVFSLVLSPLYLWRRDRQYQKIQNPNSKF